jgi:hypothetical protein
MPRGGAGKGQGRKSTVSPELEFLIREDFERLAWVQRLEQARQIANRATGMVWQEGDESDPLDVPKRFRQDVSKYGSLEPEAKIPADLPLEVRYAIDVMRANKKKLQGKPLHYKGPLPGLYRGRQAIIKDIARLRGVSARTVRSILEGKSDL